MCGKAMEPNVDKLISFWVSEADEALKVADHLVEKEDFSYALFFGHLALEKMLKALCVKQLREHSPPIRNLNRLAKIAGIALDKQAESDFVIITAFNIESRYPDFKRSFRKKCTQQFTVIPMEKIKRHFKWLKSQLS